MDFRTFYLREIYLNVFFFLTLKQSVWESSIKPKRWILCSLHSRSVQSLSLVQLFATPWTAARQASLSITNSRSLPKPMSIDDMET